MRAKDIINRSLKTFAVRIKLPQQGGYSRQMDTTVQARNHEMARRIVRAQYGDRTVIVGNPRQLS
jgi:hypothetical protein